MDGLIPMVYRSIKKQRARKRYENLSSGAAQAYNIEDFYRDDLHLISRNKYLASEGDSRGAHHRRYNSFHVDQARGFASGDDADKPKQLVRFRSHRMLSCFTGV